MRQIVAAMPCVDYPQEKSRAGKGHGLDLDNDFSASG